MEWLMININDINDSYLQHAFTNWQCVIFSCNAFSELVSFNLKWIVSVTQPPALPPFPIAKEVKEIIK